jgi:AcrR family transcriptional regulator
MPRNKYPEVTVNRILQASLKLFLEKGYENTSIKDITDHLSSLTKGAIYHHFKSKEDILIAVMDRLFLYQEQEWAAIRGDTSTQGREKLAKLLWASLNNPNQDSFFKASPNLLENPRLLMLQLKNIMEESAPGYLEPIIRQGVADGSLQTKYPREMAEVMLLLLNLWISPIVFNADFEVMERRAAFFDELFACTGFQLRTGEIKARARELHKLYQEKQ